MTQLLHHLNLKMYIRPNRFYKEDVLVRINWARKYVDNIYEVGLTFLNGFDGGICAFFEIVDNKFIYICCSHTDSPECLVIKYRKEQEDLEGDNSDII